MDDRTGETLDGRYKLEKLLGEGGMGAVYTGIHLVTGRKVAIKFLLAELATNSEAVGRFFREARAATAIKSEHICEVLDMRPPEEGTPYLVMEYLEGETLKQRIQRGGRLPLEEAVNLMLQVLEALYAAHHAGIVHRDIKPENVFLVSRTGRPPLVKLLDFGISKFNDQGGEDHSLTRTGTVLGTPYYMSPEQASGDRTVGPLSDLYAVGVMLYEVMTGVVPFNAESFSALVVKIVTETPLHPCQRVPDMPQAMGDLIMKSMARNQSVRFNDAKEMAEALRAVAQGQAIQFEVPMASDASFEAVSVKGSSSGVTAMPKTQIFSGQSGSGMTPGYGSSSGVSQTPMALERSAEQRPPKTWLFVGGGALVAVLLIAGIGGIFLVPKLLEDTTTPPPVVTSPRPDGPGQTTPGQQVATTSPQTGDAGAPARPDAQVAPIPTPADSGPSKIHVTISVTPSEATVYLDDRAVDVSAPVELASDGATHTVRATAPGHEDRTESFTASEDRQISLALARRTHAGHPGQGQPQQQGSNPPTKQPNTGNRNPIGVYTPAGWE